MRALLGVPSPAFTGPTSRLRIATTTTSIPVIPSTTWNRVKAFTFLVEENSGIGDLKKRVVKLGAVGMQPNVDFFKAGDEQFLDTEAEVECYAGGLVVERRMNTRLWKSGATGSPMMALLQDVSLWTVPLKGTLWQLSFKVCFTLPPGANTIERTALPQ